VTSGTLTTGFTYNGAGDRVARTVDGVTTDYVLDPAAGLTQVLQETSDGQTTSYLYGADLLAQYDSGTWAYHLNDGLGSVRQLADPAGQVVQGYGFRLGNPLRYAQVGERYLFDRGAGTAVADVLPPDTFTAGFGRVVSAQPSTLTGVDLQDMVTSVPLGLGVRIAKTVRLARKLPTAYAMWRGGFNVVRAGYYVPGSPKWLVYGTHAIRHGLDIPPTLSHAGTSGLTSYRHLATYARGPLEASLAALRASWLWIIGPAILVNAYEYSPWGPKGDIGYGTECAAAVTVDIVLAGASVGAGAFTMAFLITVLHVSAGPAAFVGLVVSGYILWRGAEFKEPLVKQVSGFYEAMIEELEDRW
jgi:hypothetical protein